MKPRRTWPLRILIMALVMIVLVGAGLAVMHREARPVDSGGPAASDAPH